MSLICTRKCVCPDSSHNQTWQPCSSFFASPLRMCRNSHNQEQVGWCLLRFLSWEQVIPVRRERRRNWIHKKMAPLQKHGLLLWAKFLEGIRQLQLTFLLWLSSLDVYALYVCNYVLQTHFFGKFEKKKEQVNFWPPTPPMQCFCTE